MSLRGGGGGRVRRGGEAKLRHDGRYRARWWWTVGEDWSLGRAEQESGFGERGRDRGGRKRKATGVRVGKVSCCTEMDCDG